MAQLFASSISQKKERSRGTSGGTWKEKKKEKEKEKETLIPRGFARIVENLGDILLGL